MLAVRRPAPHCRAATRENTGPMLDFYGHLWFWLAACLAVGGATGFLAPGTKRMRPARWLVWTGLAFLAGAAALALGAVRGGAALSLESALACLAFFLAGAAAAALAARGSVAAHEGWALGLAPAALLWWGATLFAQPAYQAKLHGRLAAMAQAAGADPSGLELAGRDVLAGPAIAGNQTLMSLIGSAPGVRRVVAAKTASAPVPGDDKPGEPPPAQSSIGATPPSAPGPATPPRAEAVPSAQGPALLPVEEPKEPKPAIQDAAALDSAACQRALDAATAREPVAFRPGRATVNRRVAEALDKAAEVIRRCPTGEAIEVRGFGDTGRDDELAARRAAAAERYLRREGVAGRRLVAVGAEKKGSRGSAIEFSLR